MGLVFIDLALELISLLLELKVETDLNYQKMMLQNALPYCLLKFAVPVIVAIMVMKKARTKVKRSCRFKENHATFQCLAKWSHSAAAARGFVTVVWFFGTSFLICMNCNASKE